MHFLTGKKVTFNQRAFIKVRLKYEIFILNKQKEYYLIITSTNFTE